MTTYLTAFNNLVIKFNDELIQTFPEEKDFKAYKLAIEVIRKNNAKMVCNMFKVYTLNYREKIVAKDETFFLNNDYNDIVNTKDEGIVAIINKLKMYWGTLSSDNQTKIWEYLNTLLKLADLVN